MKRPKEIKINRFQLNVLLNDEQKEGFDYILNQNVYCGNCGGVCKQGIEIKEIFLDSLNDIRIEGICKECKGKVARGIRIWRKQGVLSKSYGV
jgi:hypothetical protein